MSSYSNEPQQNKWEIWFITSITLFFLMLIIMYNIPSDKLPIIYDGLLFLTFVNLIYCIYKGFQE